MLISWSDLGRPTVPGDYKYRGELVRVDQEALSVWQAEPTARFHLVTHAPHVGVGVFTLGEFELADDNETNR